MLPIGPFVGWAGVATAPARLSAAVLRRLGVRWMRIVCQAAKRLRPGGGLERRASGRKTH